MNRYSTRAPTNQMAATVKSINVLSKGRTAGLAMGSKKSLGLAQHIVAVMSRI
jgi:hypothetical protein